MDIAMKEFPPAPDPAGRGLPADVSGAGQDGKKRKIR